MAELPPRSVRDFAERVAALRGWDLNPDPEHLASVLSELEVNRRRYGYYLCPSRDGSGNPSRDADIICPCRYAEADVAKHGRCYCGLFVGLRFAAEGGAANPIPERRPREREGGAAPLSAVPRDLCSIKDTVRWIHDLEKELKRAHRLTLNEGLCLCGVSNLSHTPGDCARQLGLSPSRISRILNSLERKGLLERRSLPDDHRSTGLVITERGRERLLELRSSGFTFSCLDTRASRMDTELSR